MAEGPITYCSMVGQIITALGERADAYDAYAIWQDIWDRYGRVDIETVDQDEFREIVARHAKP
jgi:hypothetical protein